MYRQWGQPRGVLCHCVCPTHEMVIWCVVCFNASLESPFPSHPSHTTDADSPGECSVRPGADDGVGSGVGEWGASSSGVSPREKV